MKKIVITLPDSPTELGKADEAALFYKLVADVAEKAPGSYLSAFLSVRAAEYFQKISQADFWPDVMADLATAERELETAEDRVRQLRELKAQLEGDRDHVKAEFDRWVNTVYTPEQDHAREQVARYVIRVEELERTLADVEDDLVREQQNHTRDNNWYMAEIQRLKAKLYDLAEDMAEAEVTIERLQKEARQNGQP